MHKYMSNSHLVCSVFIHPGFSSHFIWWHVEYPEPYLGIDRRHMKATYYVVCALDKSHLNRAPPTGRNSDLRRPSTDALAEPSSVHLSPQLVQARCKAGAGRWRRKKPNTKAELKLDITFSETRSELGLLERSKVCPTVSLFSPSR